MWKCDLGVSWVQTAEVLGSGAKTGEKPLEAESLRQQLTFSLSENPGSLLPTGQLLAQGQRQFHVRHAEQHKPEAPFF